MLTHGIPPDFGGLIYLNRHTPSGQSRVYRVTQLHTDGVHCRESAGTGPVVLEVNPVTGAALADITMDQLMCASLFLHPLLILNWYKVKSGYVESIGGSGWCESPMLISQIGKAFSQTDLLRDKAAVKGVKARSHSTASSDPP